VGFPWYSLVPLLFDRKALEVPIETQKMVRIKRNVPGYGDFHDAIYFTEAEFAAMSEAQVEAAIQQRITNWVATIEAARAAPKPTNEEIESARADEIFEALAGDDPAMAQVLDSLITIIGKKPKDRASLKAELLTVRDNRKKNKPSQAGRP